MTLVYRIFLLMSEGDWSAVDISERMQIDRRGKVYTALCHLKKRGKIERSGRQGSRVLYRKVPGAVMEAEGRGRHPNVSAHSYSDGASFPTSAGSPPATNVVVIRPSSAGMARARLPWTAGDEGRTRHATN